MEFSYMIANDPIMIHCLIRKKLNVHLTTINNQMTYSQLTIRQMIFFNRAHLTAISNQYAPEDSRSIRKIKKKINAQRSTPVFDNKAAGGIPGVQTRVVKSLAAHQTHHH